MKTPEEIAREIADAVRVYVGNWDGCGTEPWIDDDTLADRIAAALRVEREAREKAEREYSALLTTWAENRERHLAAEARADRIERETIERCAKVARKTPIRQVEFAESSLHGLDIEAAILALLEDQP